MCCDHYPDAVVLTAPSNMRLKLAVRALYIGASPLRRAARAARSVSATR